MGLCEEDLTKEEKEELARLQCWLKFNKGVRDSLLGKYGEAGVKEGLKNLNGAGFSGGKGSFTLTSVLDTALKIDMSEVKVRIGKKGIHGFIDMGGVTYGYGPRGIRSPDDYGSGEATYEDTDADSIATEHRINEMQKSGQWKGGWKNKGGDYWPYLPPPTHNRWDFVDKALGQ